MDRILVTEPIAEEGLAALRAQAQVDLRTDLSQAQLLDVLPGYDALVVRSGTKVTADVLEAGTRLRVVGRAGTGRGSHEYDGGAAHDPEQRAGGEGQERAGHEKDSRQDVRQRKNHHANRTQPAYPLRKARQQISYHCIQDAGMLLVL